MSIEYVSNQIETRRLITELKAYYANYVLGPSPDYEVRCFSFEKCRASGRSNASVRYLPAQLSHVGSKYLLKSKAFELRVVIVGIDYGANDHYGRSLGRRRSGRVPMSERYGMIMECARNGFKARNSHMRGTTIALQDVFGLASEQEEIVVNGTRAHIFDVFALVNLLLCSRCALGRNTRATTTMKRRCLKHFVRTMQMLRPNLLLFQGRESARLFLSEIRANTGEATIPRRFQGSSRPILDITWDGGIQTIACVFRHPSRNWSSRKAVYYRQVVRPTILEARRRLGMSNCLAAPRDG